MGEGRNGELFNGYRVCFAKGKSSGDHTTIQIYLTLQNRILRNGEVGKFNTMHCFTTQTRKIIKEVYIDRLFEPHFKARRDFVTAN